MNESSICLKPITGLLTEAAGRQAGPAPDLARAVTVATEWGPLFIDAVDEVIRPSETRDRLAWALSTRNP